MLSFDCSPNSFYANSFMAPQAFSHPFASAPRCSGYNYHRPARIVRSRSYHQPRHYHHQHPGYDLESLLNQLIGQEEEEVQRPAKTEVNYKVLRTNEVYQIQILKNGYDFKHYSITYKIVGQDALIHIESEVDDFSKTFKFSNNSIDISNVTWKLRDNILAVTIPRVHEQFIVRPQMKKVLRNVVTPKETVVPTSRPQQEPVEKPVEKKPVEKPVDKQQSKPKVLSIPIEYSSSEEEVAITPRSTRSNSFSSDTDSIRTRSESEAELDHEGEPSSKLPKLKRKVSIEEVEDETLHMADLD